MRPPHERLPLPEDAVAKPTRDLVVDDLAEREALRERDPLSEASAEGGSGRPAGDAVRPADDPGDPRHDLPDAEPGTT